MDLDPRLEAASVAVADLPLCSVRLQNDARWPWLVLVPRQAGLTELVQLDPHDWERLGPELTAADAAVRALGAAQGRPVGKINVAALGNVVPQLHVHVVGRRPDDPAWPGPVWGFGAAEPYDPGILAEAVAVARGSLSGPSR